jgi:hypothetical protein
MANEEAADPRGTPGYEVVGVSVIGPPPLGEIHLQLQPGVTAMYGLNGLSAPGELADVKHACESKSSCTLVQVCESQ